MPSDGALHLNRLRHIGTVRFACSFTPHQFKCLITHSAWFDSLSTLFLSVRTGRLLILAGRERLDTTLEIGHMQGKFQLKVMAGRGGTHVGHLVHEVSITFLCVNERGRAHQRMA